MHYPEVAADRATFFTALFDALVRSGKTFVTPGFSYTDTGTFDTQTTTTKVSAFSKWLVGRDQVSRSEHPLFSFLSLGPERGLVEGVGKSAFGAESVHARLYGRNAVFVHLGRPVAMGNTMLHHVEQLCGATYRIHKAFKTDVVRGSQRIGTDYTAFVRRRDVPGELFYFRFDLGARALEEAGLITLWERSDPVYIASYPYDATRDVLIRLFYANQTAFVQSTFMQY
jgi:aminoglycoside N3'-acetyltransferase